jgi:RimJ/RimL family protein N-acetyltransferase
MGRLEDYSSIEALRDGRRVEIRALRPADRQGLARAVDRTSMLSLYRRFFAVRAAFTEEETAFFVNVDFKKHVAIVAVIEEGGRPTIVGGGRYVLVESGVAEVAFTIIDAYQGKGIGTILLRHLVAIAKGAGLRSFVAEVLPENIPMLRLFEQSGLRLNARTEPDVMHLTLDL